MSINYNPRVVTDGLVLALDAGNTKSYPGSGTTWTDLSGRGNNGTLINGPTYSSDNGGAIVFDGSNTFVELSNFGKTSYGTTNFSLSLWFNADSGPYRSLFQAAIDASYPWIAYIAYGSGFSVYVNDNYRINVPYTQGVWNNFVLTFDSAGSGLWTAYLNGSIVSTYTGPIGSRSTSRTYLGVAYGGVFDGKISYFGVQQKTLTASEVQQNYNATKSRYQ